MENLYKPIKTKQLLEYVQAEGEQLSNKEVKKKLGTKTMMRRSRALSEARMELIGRLKEMDRFSPDFFLVGSKVEYRNPSDWNHPRTGVVQGHENGYVIVLLHPQLTGINNSLAITTEWPIKVEPRFLKLMYIRQKY